MRLRGHIDNCSRAAVTGWAIGDTEIPVELVAEVDGAPLGKFLADAMRDDLHRQCGFTYRFSEPLRPSAKSIRIYFAATGEDLANSPIDLKHHLERLSASELAWANQIEMPDNIEMRRIGSNSVDAFLQQGTRMAKVISENITEF